MSSESILGPRFTRWLKKRIPRAASVELAQRSIFVFPTKAGFNAGILLVILLLTAINYQNSMIYLLTFLLSVIFVLAIHLSFQNMQGLIITRQQVLPAFAGENLLVTLSLTSKYRRAHNSLTLSWPDECGATTSVEAQSQAVVQLTLNVTKRGKYQAGRLLIESVYPFGIIRTWSWLDLDVTGIVYPALKKGNPQPVTSAEGGQGEQSQGLGNDEFHGLRAYAHGDSLKHVAWKQFARQGQMLTKEFESPKVQVNVFSLADYAHVGLELALSHLCFDLVDAETRGQHYALDIAGSVSEMATGPAHLHGCLKNLALY